MRPDRKTAILSLAFLPPAVVFFMASALYGVGGVIDSTFLFVSAAALLICVCLYAAGRTARKPGFLFFVLLNVYTVIFFERVLSASGAENGSAVYYVLKYHISAAAVFFVYYTTVFIKLFLKRDHTALSRNGLTAESVIYILAALIIQPSQLLFFAVCASLPVLYSELYGGRKEKAASFSVFVLSAVSYALFYASRWSLGRESAGVLKALFYSAAIALCAVWFLHAVFAYGALKGASGEYAKGIRRYIVVSLFPFFTLLCYIFYGIWDSAGGAGLFFAVKNAVLSNLLQALFWIAAAASALYALSGVNTSAAYNDDAGEDEASPKLKAGRMKKSAKKPGLKAGEDGTGVDELGISLTFEEDIAKRNIDIGDDYASLLYGNTFENPGAQSGKERNIITGAPPRSFENSSPAASEKPAFLRRTEAPDARGREAQALRSAAFRSDARPEREAEPDGASHNFDFAKISERLAIVEDEDELKKIEEIIKRLNGN